MQSLEKINTGSKGEIKALFASDNFYRELFGKGEVFAMSKKDELLAKAFDCGSSNVFKKKFDEHRKNILKDRAMKLNTNDDAALKLLNMPNLKIPDKYRLDLNLGILKFDEDLCEFVEFFPQIVLLEERYINVESGEEKNKISFLDRLKKKSIVVDAETISSNSSIIKLRNLGVFVTSENSKKLVSFLSELLFLNNFELEPKNSIGRVGWIQEKFIPYDDNFIFDGEHENKALFDSISEKGDFGEWLTYTQALRKNKLLRLQMASSLASPLIGLTNSLPFVFHLWGGTGSGKTVGLMVAMSIWGNPVMGKLVRTMNMTQNSMMTTAAFLHSMPFAGDELQIIKSRWSNYDNLIMAITEGVDRGRMEGHINRRLKEWQCAFLFTGEEPCTGSESGGGTKNRVIEVECSEKVVEDGNKTVEFVKNNYGLLGIQFIDCLKKYDINLEFREIFKQMLNENTTEKQAMSLSLMLLADKIANENFYLDEPPLTISDVAHYLKDSAEVDVTERAYNFLLDYIFINKNEFSDLTNFKYGEIDNIKGLVTINSSVLKKALHEEGYSLKAMMGKWIDKGYLLNNGVSKIFKIDNKSMRGYQIKLEDFGEFERILAKEKEIIKSFEI